MVSLQLISIAAHPLSRVMWEKVTVIWTLNVLEALFVEQTTVEQNIRRREVTGRVLPIAVQVYIIASLFILFLICSLHICKVFHMLQSL